jgi:hypothetical protein
MVYLFRLMAKIGWIWSVVFAAILLWKLRSKSNEEQH